MSIGKNSISRLSKTATAEGGIRSLAPEVPVGDAATAAPFAVEAMTEAAPEAPAAETVPPKASGKKPGRKPKAQTAVAEKETPATVAPKKRGRKPSNAKTEAKAAPAKKTAAKAPAKASTKKPTTVKKVSAPKGKDGFITVQVGEAMPYWLL